ncbi:hypothetical protein SCA6_001471 [Theobroma cacao]
MGSVLLTSSAFFRALFLALCAVWLLPDLALAKHAGITRHYKFNIRMQNVTRLCQTKSIVTVNGQFPGPRIIAREGDRLLIKVVNHVQYNVTLHWHGIRQLRTGWADGPAYITQCPIQTGQSYVYNFTITGQRGTLFWHAHISWLRATLYGPIVILPKRHASFPFPQPFKEVPIIFGEWWKADTETIINQAMATGGAPNISDAFTINGLPGPSYNCSAKARPYATGIATFDNTTTIGILEYEKSASASNSKNKKLPLLKAKLPQFNDSTYAMKFNQKLRSLATTKFPVKVPKNVDRRFFFTVGLGILPCSQNQTCQGPNNTRPAAAVNNVSFVQPNIALLQAHFFNRSKGVYTTNFPANPPFKFNYTGTPPRNIMLDSGTKVVVLPFNTSVELVMQDTSILGAESHPLHLHGFNFFVLGQGVGNFDPKKDPAKFNLVDPAERNTVGVPSGGWVAIRFLADNPGVWFMHCHLEVHTSWGLKMAWVVNDGKGRKQKLLPPPADLPKC